MEVPLSSQMLVISHLSFRPPTIAGCLKAESNLVSLPKQISTALLWHPARFTGTELLDDCWLWHNRVFAWLQTFPFQTLLFKADLKCWPRPPPFTSSVVVETINCVAHDSHIRGWGQAGMRDEPDGVAGWPTNLPQNPTYLKIWNQWFLFIAGESRSTQIKFSFGDYWLSKRWFTGR